MRWNRIVYWRGGRRADEEGLSVVDVYWVEWCCGICHRHRRRSRPFDGASQPPLQ